MFNHPRVCLIKSPGIVTRSSLSNVAAPPIGIAYLAGTLLKNGYPVQVIDSIGESPDQLTPLGFMDGFELNFIKFNILQNRFR